MGARGNVHTNGVEGLWSLLPAVSDRGLPHKVTVKHLERYLDELAWRFNNRDTSDIFRDTLDWVLNHHPLRYADLTA